MFPILLALGLGIAFRNKPPDAVRVVVAQQPGCRAYCRTAAASPVSQWRSSLKVELQPPAQAALNFRLGKFDVELLPHSAGGRVRVRSGTSGKRPGPQPCQRRSAGRRRKQTLRRHRQANNSEPGSRYIDFLIPGLLGMNLMGSGMWGIGFALVDMRQRKLLKRYVATPMRRGDFLLALATSRLILMITELALMLGFGVFAFHMRVVARGPPSCW